MKIGKNKIAGSPGKFCIKKDVRRNSYYSIIDVKKEHCPLWIFSSVDFYNLSPQNETLGVMGIWALIIDKGLQNVTYEQIIDKFAQVGKRKLIFRIIQNSDDDH